MPFANMTSNYPAYQLGGVIATLVAKPLHDDIGEFEAGYLVLMNEALHAVSDLPGSPHSPWLQEIEFKHAPYSSARRFQNNLKNWSKFRMQAAHVAMYYLHEAKGKRAYDLLGGSGKRLSLNKIIDHMADKGVIENPENFEARVWLKTKPVIHIMVAIANAIEDNILEGYERTNVGDLIFSDMALKIVETAPRYARLIADSSAPVKFEDMIPFLRH